MAAHVPQVVAVHNDRVVGYNLAMTPDMKNVLSTLIPMFNAFDNISYQGKPISDYDYIVGGQVCVDPEFRGQGLLKKLYQATKERTAEHYELCVTEVSSEIRSR